MSNIPQSCLKDGHGPSIVIRRRVWWAPWRSGFACWVCRTPLSTVEAAEADALWRGERAS